MFNYDYASVHVTHESGVGKIRAEWRTDRFSDISGSVVKGLGVAIFIFAFWFLVLQFMSWLFEHHAQQATPTPSPSLSVQQATATPTRSPSPPSRLSADYNQFIAGFAKLEGRDREQEEYIAAAVGKEVTWDVPFEHARTVNDGVYFSFGNVPGAPVTAGSVPFNMQDRIFALHRGDVIRIRGQLAKIHSLALFVQVSEFELLRQATSPSASPAATQSPNK